MASIPTPVSAADIARTSYEQQFLIEDRVLSSLVDVVNEGIRDQVSHGMLAYEVNVPCFIMGFPRFNVDYVADRIRCMYRDKGFVVTGEGAHALISWPKKPSKKITNTNPGKGLQQQRSQSNSKKVLLLPG